MRPARSARAAAVPDAVLKFVLSTPWAISDEGLHRVLAVASRGYLHPEALEQVSGEYVERTRATTVRDGVATIPIEGVLMRRASLFDAMCGACDYHSIAHDLRTALDDPRITRVVLLFDSPGGEVSGCSELAQQIRAGREEKPIDAYVGGDCMSAAYWLASSCRGIYVADTALTGNIGVRLTYVDDTKRLKREGIERITIVSSQSPAKEHAPTTDAGRARAQAMVDQLASVFLASVAEGRGVSVADVIARYGDGRVSIGAAAVEDGLADGVTTYEALLASYSAASRGTPPTEDTSMPAAKPKAKAAPPARSRPKAAAPRASADTPEEEKPTPAAAEGDPARCAECDAELPAGAAFCPACGEPASAGEPEGSQDGADTPDEEEDPPATATATAIAAAVTAERTRIVGILGYANRFALTSLMPLIEDASCSKEQAAARLLEIGADAPRGSRLRALKGDDAALAAAKTTTGGAVGGSPVASRMLANYSRVNPNAVPDAARAAAGSR